MERTVEVDLDGVEGPVGFVEDRGHWWCAVLYHERLTGRRVRRHDGTYAETLVVGSASGPAGAVEVLRAKARLAVGIG